MTAAKQSPSVQLGVQRSTRNPLVTHAEASLSRMADTVESDHVELAQEIAQEAMAAWRAYVSAVTPAQMAEASRRGRANVKRQMDLERMAAK